MIDVLFVKALEPGINGLDMAKSLLRRMRGLTKPSACSLPLERVEREQAVDVVERHMAFIKKDMKARIHMYDPLTFKPAFHGFLRWLGEDGYLKIREMPGHMPVEEYLSRLGKEFLIRTAYYALEERYIRRRVAAKLGALEDNNIKLMEIVDFIIEGVEKNNFKRLNYFREEAKFKTFFSTVVSSLLNDFWRRHYKIAKEVTTYEVDFNDAFEHPHKNPEEKMLHIEHQRDREAAAKLLPGILERLTAEEVFVIKMRFEKGMKISPIARALGRSDYKTKQFIEKTLRKISVEMAQRLENYRGGHNDPS